MKSIISEEQIKELAERLGDEVARRLTPQEFSLVSFETRRILTTKYLRDELTVALKGVAAGDAKLARAATELVEIYDAQAADHENVTDCRPGDKFWERFNQFCKQVRRMQQR